MAMENIDAGSYKSCKKYFWEVVLGTMKSESRDKATMATTAGELEFSSSVKARMHTEMN